MNKRKKILEISKKLGLTHIGSCLSVLPILEEIYKEKKDGDIVLLDNAHAHLAHLMFTNPEHAEESIKKYGIHCEKTAGCDASGGSLGHAGGIAIGMALANKDKNIYVIFSDGSIQEGSNWEALRIMESLRLKNIRCYFNINGYTALEKINKDLLANQITHWYPQAKIRFTSNGRGYGGVKGHYTQVL